MRVRFLGLAAGVILLTRGTFAQAPVSSATPPRDAVVTASIGTAHLRGRVVAADSGTPLRRAQVRVTALANRETRLSSTDTEGRYQFSNLPAGRYSLHVSKAGYVGLEFGQRRPFESGRPLELVDSEVVDGLNFALPRGSVIVGRITDEAGDPVVGASVQAMRHAYTSEGRRQLVSVPSANWYANLTNDLGEFRLFGLMPGAYFVSAHAQNADILGVSEPSPTSGASLIDRPTGYVQTHYPGTANVSEAQPIVVSLSDEAHASFSLVRGRMAQVSGTVTRSDGTRIAGSRIILRPDDRAGGSMGSWGTSTVAANGSFRFGNVPPGRFILDVIPSRSPDSNAVLEFARMPLTVNGRDLSGIAVTTRPGVSVSGHVTFETRSTLKAQTRGGPYVIAVPSDSSEMSFRGYSGTGGTLDGGGRFQMRNAVGTVLFRLMNLPSAVVLKSVSLNGRDVTDTPYDTTDGDVTDLEITIVEAGQIAGTVRNARGEEVKDFRVILFPAGVGQGIFAVRRVRTVAADAIGRFQIGGLVAGEYSVVAVESLENGQEWDPAFQQRVAGASKRVAVKEGETLTVELPYAE